MSSSLSKLSARWLASWHQDCTCLCLEKGRDLVLVPEACQGWMVTPPVEVSHGFHRAIPSWNLLQPEGSSYQVEFRARGANGCWTSWFSNETPEATQEPYKNPMVSWDIDQLLSKETMTAFQLRVHLRRESANHPSPALRTLYLASKHSPWEERRTDVALPQTSLKRESFLVPGMGRDSYSSVGPISLPFVYQHDLDPGIGGRICSPTSVSMVLQGAGIKVEALEVARLAYHSGYKIYGVWPLAVHAAYQLGLKGWVQFINSWREAESYLRKGIPLVTSIAFSDGDLKEPPYPPTEGHLLVLLGIDEQGRPITHDPHLPRDQGAYLHWNREDFSKAWLERGGVAYVFPSKRH